MNPADMDAIAFVAALRHRIGTERKCRCEECRAIVRVVALAQQAVAVKNARRIRRQPLPLSSLNQDSRR